MTSTLNYRPAGPIVPAPVNRRPNRTSAFGRLAGWSYDHRGAVLATSVVLLSVFIVVATASNG